MTTNSGFTPMKADRLQHFIERAYREGGKFLWVRETYINAVEAGATKIAFEIEEQAVRNKKVYRRIIADNGKGMDRDELLTYFNTYGGGGKPIGGEHENYGIGSKTSLLPWNSHGIVVISYKDGNATMIWLRRDDATGEYGLRTFECKDEEDNIVLDSAVEPFPDFDEYGCDWADVKPDWIDQHGTVVVLLGESPESDTVSGDVSREESSVDGITKYLNTRIWKIPEGTSVHVRELTHSDKHNWPAEIGVETGVRRRQLNRSILGAWKHLYEPGSWKHSGGNMKGFGTLDVPGGTELHWACWEGERPEIGAYAQKDGYIAVLYNNELYSLKNHGATYKTFGIANKKVRSRVWIIAKPPAAGGESDGVYPRGDRNSLLMRGGKHAGQDLPFYDWGQFFSENMPDTLREALLAERGEDAGTLDDPTWRDKLASIFGNRWRIKKYFLRPGPGGSRGRTVSASSHGSSKRTQSNSSKPEKTTLKPASSPKNGALAGSGSVNGDKREKGVHGGLPSYVWRPACHFENRGFLASYYANDPSDENGVVYMNEEHPVILEMVAYWQDKYPSHFASVIEQQVRYVYGSNAVARIAHSQSLQSFFTPEVVREQFHSDVALTMSLLGIIAEDAQIATRVGGACGRRRTA